MADQSATLTSDQLTTLAIEHWRLQSALLNSPGSSPVARHALRKIADLLKQLGIEVRSFDGTPYDPGLNVKVVDRLEPEGRGGKENAAMVIVETVSPMVLWNQKTLKTAEVVVGPGNKIM